MGSLRAPYSDLYFFLLYINDLAEVSKELYTLLFADDTNVFICGNDIKTIANKMNDELNNIVEWLEANRLSLNINKTKFMIFKPKRRKILDTISINLNGVNIQEVDKIKFLGVVLDNKLGWKEHISYISNKISKCVGILYKTKKLLNHSCLITLYNSFLQPYISYSIHVWGGTYNSYLQSLCVIQNKAIRIICNLRKYDSVTSSFTKLSILKLDNIYKQELILFMFKFYNQLLPPIFHNYFTKNCNIHSYNTRNAYNLRIPLFQSVLGQNSFYYNAAKWWNSVGSKLYSPIGKDTLKAFKKRLKIFLLDNQ